MYCLTGTGIGEPVKEPEQDHLDSSACVVDCRLVLQQGV